jgi:hypothetical protein
MSKAGQDAERIPGAFRGMFGKLMMTDGIRRNARSVHDSIAYTIDHLRRLSGTHGQESRYDTGRSALGLYPRP